MPEDGVECKSFTVNSIDSLLVYDDKYYLQVCLDNCAYKVVNNQMRGYLNENLFETDEDYILQMLYHDRIDTSKETDPAKGSSSEECMVCHYWVFNHGFKYQDSVCNGCHDLLIQCVNINDIAILTVEGVDYHCIIHDISKSDAINLLKNSVLDDRGYI